MERSVAARPPVSSLDILWRPFEAAGSLARSSFQTIARHRRLRIALLTALVALPLLAGGWVLLRKSSFTAVEHVEVSGLRGPQAQAIEAALNGAASHMSTLDVHSAALRAAVASFPVVSAVRAIPRFPHGLRIEVTEQLPVAALTIAGQRTAVAADGVVLGPALLSSSLPALSDQQGAVEPVVGRYVPGQSLLAELTVLGAAPESLQRFIARVFTSPGGQGLTVAMRNGLLVYFGDAARPHAKWLSLARVLADSSSAGAVYVDVRVPERPAAGFSSADAPSASMASTGQQQATTPEATVAALAAGLTDDTNGQPAASSTATTPTSASTSTAEAASSTAPAEAGSSTGTAGAVTTSEPEPAATATAPDG
jgi:cell division protein FtsQ